MPALAVAAAALGTLAVVLAPALVTVDAAVGGAVVVALAIGFGLAVVLRMRRSVTGRPSGRAVALGVVGSLLTAFGGGWTAGALVGVSPARLVAGVVVAALGVAALVAMTRAAGRHAGQAFAMAGTALGVLSAVLYTAVFVNTAPIRFGIGDDDNAWTLLEMRRTALEQVDRLRPGACVNVRFASRGAPPSRLVEPVDCARPHNAEVTGRHVLDVGSHPDAGALERRADDLCGADLERHLGRPHETDDTTRQVIWWIPTEDDLTRGERYIVCAVVNGEAGDV